LERAGVLSSGCDVAKRAKIGETSAEKESRGASPHVSDGPHEWPARESPMTKKQRVSKIKAKSALGPLAHGLIQGYLGPDHKVTDMERFFTGLMQALHDAYGLGWKDRGDVEKRAK
jgi:hypothetical protein